MKKWSEFYIIRFLEVYFNNDYSKRFKGRMPFDEKLRAKSQKLFIEAVLSELNPYVWIRDFDGTRYYPDNDVKKELGLMYSDLEQSYVNLCQPRLR